MMKWIDPFEKDLRRVLGMNDVTLHYISRLDERVSIVIVDPIVCVYSTSYTSLFDEMIHYFKLSGSTYNKNKSHAFGCSREEFSGTIHSQYLRSFSCRRDGKLSHLAIFQQHLGLSKLEEEIEKAEYMVMINQWNGHSVKLSLRNNITNHRIVHIMMETVSQYITYDPLDETTRVKHLITYIISKCMPIISVITAIKGDNSMADKQRDFEEENDDYTVSKSVRKSIIQFITTCIREFRQIKPSVSFLQT